MKRRMTIIRPEPPTTNTDPALLPCPGRLRFVSCRYCHLLCSVGCPPTREWPRRQFEFLVRFEEGSFPLMPTPNRLNDSFRRAPVAVGVHSLRHFRVGVLIGQQLPRFADNRLPRHANDLRHAKLR